MSIRHWWHEVTYDDWPYELPEHKKWWMPTFLNDWLGDRTYNAAVLNRPYCWIKGHLPEREVTSLLYCLRCSKTLEKRSA